MALPGIYRVQSAAEIPIVRRNKYQAQNREKTWEFCDRPPGVGLGMGRHDTL